MIIVNKKKRCLIITNLFPNTVQKTRGMFVWQEIQQLKEYYDLIVISPLPWVPPFLRNKPKYNYHHAQDFSLLSDMECYYPRYIVVPRLMRSMYGFMMSLGVKKCVESIARKWSPDFVIAYYAFPDGFTGLRIARKLKIPVMVKVLGSDVNVFTRSRFRRWMTRYTLCSANSVIAKSNALKNRTIALGVPEKLVSVITNGVDKRKFFPRDRKECRRMINLPSVPFIFIYIGNMVETKGIDVLLDSFEAIPEELRFTSVLVLVGGGEKDKEIEKRANQSGLTGLVIKSPSVSHDEIPIWLGASDCLILPSFNEGYPNVIVEAFACGRPVIASNVGGVPEIVQHGINGLLVSPNNCASLTNAMISFLQGPQSQKYDVPTVTRTWADVAENMDEEIQKMCYSDKDEENMVIH